MIESVISHYRIIEKLGQGGMGVVYKAEDSKLNRPVALKFLPPDLTLDKEANRRFVYEAQTASALDHQNITTIYEIDESDDGRLFICMAYYEGLTLKQKIAQGPLQIEEALDITIQIAHGLAKAHEKGIIHRDINPANIIVQRDGTVKIIDFGLSKLLGEQNITKSGATLGTIGYMSPEQIHGKGVNYRTDIWALGVVLYEMLTGERPFKGDIDQAVIYSILNEDPEPISNECYDIPPKLELIVNRVIQKIPENRYQNFLDMIQDLNTVDGGIHKLPVKHIHPLQKIRKKSRKTLIGLVSTGVALIAAVLFLINDLRETGQVPESKQVIVSVFDNQTGDKSLNPLGRIAVDWITQGLANTGVAEVVSTLNTLASSNQIESNPDSRQESSRIRTLAKETHARFVISGAYYAQEGDLHVLAKITDVNKDKVIGVFSSSGALNAPLITIDNLRNRVVGGLASHLDRRINTLTHAMSGLPTYEAYLEFIDGLDALSDRKFFQAIRGFNRAVAIDSNFIIPMIYATDVYLLLEQHSKAQENLTILHRHRNKLSLFEKYNLDRHQSTLNGDYSAAVKALQKMSVIAPRDGLVHFLLGTTLVETNRSKQALKAFEKVDPNRGWMRGWYPYWIFLTAAYHMSGEHAKELKQARIARQLYPDHEQVLVLEVRALAALGRVEDIHTLIQQHANMGVSTVPAIMRNAGHDLYAHGYTQAGLELLNQACQEYATRFSNENSSNESLFGYALSLYTAERWHEAEPIFARLASEYPEKIRYQGYLGLLAARRGDRAETQKILKMFEQLERPYLFGYHTFWQACLAAVLGEKERAMILLHRAFKQGHKFGLNIHQDKDLEPLWDYPPFMELLQQNRS